MNIMVEIEFVREKRGGQDPWETKHNHLVSVFINNNKVPLFVSDTQEEYVFETKEGIQLGHEPDYDERGRDLKLDTYKSDFERSYSTSEELEKDIEKCKIIVRDKYL